MKIHSYAVTFDTEKATNDQGIPRREANPAPVIPRRGAPPSKSRIRGVQRVITVASGKGGVGKSTVAGEIYCSSGGRGR
jgi:ATP-binding protein involved in chromosome partitioning